MRVFHLFPFVHTLGCPPPGGGWRTGPLLEGAVGGADWGCPPGGERAHSRLLFRVAAVASALLLLSFPAKSLASNSFGVIFCQATILPADTPAPLPAAWCRAYFGSDSVDPADDPDTDGLSNAEEYALGTDPLLYDTDGDGMGDGNEMYYEHDPLVPHEPPLAFTAIEPRSDGTVLLRWSTMYGLGYLPQFKDDLSVPAWSNLVRHVIWEGTSWPSGEQSVLDRDAPKHPARFYRVITVDED